MPAHCRFPLAALVLFAAGCGSGQPATPTAVSDGRSDLERVRAADVSILFVGNSHTMYHDLPNFVREMIRFRHPGKAVYAHAVSVVHLEDTARDPRCREEIETRPWAFVVLQGQKISRSGKIEYSRAEGIETAKLAKACGATVFFYSEWGLRDDPTNGPRHEKVYTEMAREVGAGVVPVGRAWDLALAKRSEMPLHDPDGNHQSQLGAFLTACVLFGRLTGESPAPLAAFAYPHAGDADRRFLADAAAEALARKGDR